KTGKGRVAFRGEVQFSDGEWVGVILDEPRGKNNGTVQGVQYFTCEPNYGLFIRPTQLKPESARSRTSGLRTPATRKEVAAPPKAARSSPSGSPKVSPSVSLERLSKAAGPKRVLSSSKLVDNANELDSLKLRNEELEADLEILREEMAAGGGGLISEGNSVQLKQLEMQNERLKEALIK
ncbi:CAP-Gly domain protein, partial [Teladorsagia circumcincta]